jgi:hypothetical protein
MTSWNFANSIFFTWQSLNTITEYIRLVRIVMIKDTHCTQQASTSSAHAWREIHGKFQVITFCCEGRCRQATLFINVVLGWLLWSSITYFSMIVQEFVPGWRDVCVVWLYQLPVVVSFCYRVVKGCRHYQQLTVMFFRVFIYSWRPVYSSLIVIFYGARCCT